MCAFVTNISRHPAAGMDAPILHFGQNSNCDSREDGVKPIVLPLFSFVGYADSMSQDCDALTPATAQDVADALAFALRFQGRKRTHNADELMSAIVARRLVEHLERSGFVVMKRPPIGGSAPHGRGV